MKKTGDNNIVRIGILHSQIRIEEKLIYQACKELGVECELIDVRKQIFHSSYNYSNLDIILERCVSSSKGMYATKFFESINIPVINSSTISSICWDKYYTSLFLSQHKIPVVEYGVAFSEEQAKELVQKLGGYPVVIKATKGSWGRLISKVNDDEALEAIIEHKNILGGVDHQSAYMQKYIPKQGRDIRSFIVGNKTIAAIYRSSDHWITNTSRGGTASKCEVTNDISSIGQLVTEALGEGIISLDLFETPQGLVINEINHTTEFRNSQEPTGVNIAQEIAKYCIKVGEELNVSAN